MLYKSGGDQHLPQHGGYFSLTVVQETDVGGLIADGWSLTPDEALSNKPKIEPVTPVPYDPDKGPEQFIAPAPKRRGRKPKAAE